jgi:hypothetical protein
MFNRNVIWLQEDRIFNSSVFRFQLSMCDDYEYIVFWDLTPSSAVNFDNVSGEPNVSIFGVNVSNIYQFARRHFSYNSTLRQHKIYMDYRLCNFPAELFLQECRHAEPITLAVRSKAWTVSPPQTLRSWIRNPLEAWMFALFHFCVVLCVGSGPTTGLSPVQGVLQAVYRIRKTEKDAKAQWNGW